MGKLELNSLQNLKKCFQIFAIANANPALKGNSFQQLVPDVLVKVTMKR